MRSRRYGLQGGRCPASPTEIATNSHTVSITLHRQKTAQNCNNNDNPICSMDRGPRIKREDQHRKGIQKRYASSPSLEKIENVTKKMRTKPIAITPLISSAFLPFTTHSRTSFYRLWSRSSDAIDLRSTAVIIFHLDCACPASFMTNIRAGTSARALANIRLHLALWHHTWRASEMALRRTWMSRTDKMGRPLGARQTKMCHCWRSKLVGSIHIGAPRVLARLHSWVHRGWHEPGGWRLSRETINEVTQRLRGRKLRVLLRVLE